MKIQVSLFAVLQEDRFEDRLMEVEAGLVMDGLLRRLNLKRDDVGFIIVNGKDGTFIQEIQDGDRITIIPPLMGG